LDWRLDDTGHRNAGQGPLPWLPGIPQGLRDHPVWGNYLAVRSDLVRTLADQVKATVADTDSPAWGTRRGTVLPGSVIRDVEVWRAAMQVSPEDRRPTGPVQLQMAARTWQRHLDHQVAGDRVLALQEWGWLLDQLSPKPNPGSVRPNARGPAGGALPRRRRRVAAALFGHHQRRAAAR
jgi:hypothetical protein